jgi:uncharacterized small protein (DUF1192 family)
MSPKELVEQNSIFLEDLQRWVVPLEVVEEALQIKSAKELEDNLGKLQDSMSELNKLFNDLGNANG